MKINKLTSRHNGKQARATIEGVSYLGFLDHDGFDWWLNRTCGSSIWLNPNCTKVSVL